MERNRSGEGGEGEEGLKKELLFFLHSQTNECARLAHRAIQFVRIASPHLLAKISNLVNTRPSGNKMRKSVRPVCASSTFTKKLNMCVRLRASSVMLCQPHVPSHSITEQKSRSNSHAQGYYYITSQNYSNLLQRKKNIPALLIRHHTHTRKHEYTHNHVHLQHHTASYGHISTCANTQSGYAQHRTTTHKITHAFAHVSSHT